MRSFISSAVLATAIFGSAAMGASIAHPHAKFHEKKSAPVEERSTQFLASSDAAVLATIPCIIGTNEEYTDEMAVGVGDSGPFVMELDNQSDQDIIVVLWAGGSIYEAFSVNVVQPNVTSTLQSKTQTYISFNPDNYVNNTISGALAPVYPGTAYGTTHSNAAQVSNTWAEFTFLTNGQWGAQSTMDVSRLINADGSTVDIKTYASAPSEGENAACTATMDSCVYECTDGETAPCMKGAITECSGENNSDGYDGGCTGFGLTSGYAVVTFY